MTPTHTPPLTMTYPLIALFFGLFFWAIVHGGKDD
jgi:hypothetical protein